MRLYERAGFRDPIELYDRVLAVEALRGFRSANTANLAGLALHLQTRYESALETFEEGLTLSPQSHALLYNKGLALWRLGRFDESVEFYELAIHLKPAWERPYEGLVRTRLSQRKLELAEQVLLLPHFEEEGESVAFRHLLTAHIEAERALILTEDEQQESAVEAARLSLEHFEEAKSLGRRFRTSRDDVAAAIAAGETDPIFEAMTHLLSEEPPLPRRLSILLRHWPEELGEHHSPALQKYFTSVEKRLDASQ